MAGSLQVLFEGGFNPGTVHVCRGKTLYTLKTFLYALFYVPNSLFKRTLVSLNRGLWEKTRKQ